MSATDAITPARARMTDVARAAGVSLVTVSRAINAPTKLAPETLSAVRAAIERLGYVPNLMAGGLASSRSRIVAAIVPTISNLVFSETIEALSQTLAEGGYQLLLGQSGYRSGDEAALVEAFLGRRVDALVLTGCSQDQALRARLRRAGLPVVQTGTCRRQARPPRSWTWASGSRTTTRAAPRRATSSSAVTGRSASSARRRSARASGWTVFVPKPQRPVWLTCRRN